MFVLSCNLDYKLDNNYILHFLGNKLEMLSSEEIVYKNLASEPE